MRHVNRLSSTGIAAALLAIQGGFGTAGAQELFRDPQFAVHVTEGIVYGTGIVQSPGGLQEKELLLDLYQPTGPDVPDSLPGILLYNGYAFLIGSRQEPGWTATVTAPMFAERGYVAASIDYRLAADNPVISSEYDEIVAAATAAGIAPEISNAGAAAMEDALLAYHYFVDNADSLHLDTTRIAMGGASAGGVMSNLWAYHLDDFGITDLPPIGAIFAHAGVFPRPPFEDDVEPGEPPMFLVVGELDVLHPFEEHVRKVEWLEAAGIPVEFHHRPWSNLAAEQLFEEASPGMTIFDRAIEFLYFHLFAAPGIDVLAGSKTDPINPLGPGNLAVAILGSDTFDVADVDRSTLTFGPHQAPRVRRKRVRLKDTNLDGFKDLVSHYRIHETGIALGDREACLSGDTAHGMSFQACDQITTLPRKCGLGFELACLLLPLLLARKKWRFEGD